MEAGTYKRYGLLGLAASLLFTVAVAPAATTPGSVAGPDVALQELEEVQVSGTRLWRMRRQMVELENRFFSRYNELNKNDDFDVHCQKEAPLGTRLESRICKAAYFEDAEADQAQAFLAGVVNSDPLLIELDRQQEYEQAALAVINSDARLQRLMRERLELEKRYVAERKERFKDRWILLEQYQRERPQG